MATKRQRSLSGDENEAIPLKRPRPNDLSHADYTIAWICALHLELAASRALLDEQHDSLPANDGDHNAYVLGRIAQHNVVMVALPAVYGKVNAATVSTNLKRSFPNIKATLMVGIGGGAPGEADLYLGDVVVGTRVMEYDLGKATNDGQFEITAFPKHPSSLLRSAVVNLRSEHGMNRSSVRSQELMRTRLSQYHRPTQPDRLFQASHPHPPDATTCDDCDGNKLQPRQRRLTDDFIIHYGVIASGDSVNKDAIKRDAVSRKLEAKCFEMESAGIMDSLECLPIRGICDYSDSHKNKAWQDYAAATAAAYARELLETIPSLTPGHVPSIATGSVTVRLSPSPGVELIERYKSFLDVLDFPQINARKEAIRAEQGRTCRWFLAHPKYRIWADISTQGTCCSCLLWIRGKAGAGKSTLMKFLYSEVRKKRSEATVVSFFFNARGDYLEKSITGMYRSLLKQILTQIPDLQFILGQMEFSSTCEPSNPSLNLLKDLFKHTIMALGHKSLICFIDALDECNEDDVRDMVQFFEDLTESATDGRIQFRVCFSSRPYPYIQVTEEHLITLENEAGHSEDLAKYVGKCLKAPKRIQAEIQRHILEKASGVFLWVVLVVGILNKETGHGGLGLRRRLSEIPPTLSRLFKDILIRDKERPEELRRCILWVLCAFRPLTPAEFCHGMWAAGLKDGSVDDEIPDVEDNETHMALATSSSKGLVEVTNASRRQSAVQFIHESVRDYLIKERGLQELWPDLGFEWEGPSHEILRSCCESYLMTPAVMTVVKGYRTTNVNADENDPHIVADNVPAIRDTVDSLETPNAEAAPTKTYAFLEYASQHILDHANKAAPSVPQKDFLSRFFLSLGPEALDHCQLVKSRRYGRTATPAYILADKGLASLLRLVLEADPSLTHDRALRFYHPFFAAMANGHKNTVAVLLGLPSIIYEGENLMEGLDRISDLKRFKNRTPMSWAVQEGRAKLVSVLARSGENITQRDYGGYTPLQRAAKNDQTATLKFLIDSGMSVSDGDYARAIQEAIVYTRHGTARALLNEFDGWDKMPMRPLYDHSRWLFYAACDGFEDLVQLLIQKGAKMDGTQFSPIVSAAEKGHLTVVKLLADNGASVDSSHSTDGRTPLMAAVGRGQEATVLFLLDRGADLNATCNNGLNAYQYAEKGGHDAIARVLQQALDKG
ncbi:hypothetical protein PG991_003555 [Apiospora marii]|uniref:NACHT domain-containing protein n=1 Tax=Apiospora marii TaxID=335849 RepID=A0ABR1S3U9_9PEZI